MMEGIIQVIMATLGTVGFGILFNTRGKRLLVAGLGGMLSWSVVLICRCFIPSEPINYFISALLTSFFAEIMARVMKTPTTTFDITALVPLVPGGSLYSTMAFALGNEMDRFTIKALDTLKLASALALGIIAATTITKVIQDFRRRRKVKLAAAAK